MLGGFYHMLFGINPYTPLLVKALGFDLSKGPELLGKPCDIFANEDGDRLYLLTRNGDGIGFDDNALTSNPNFLAKWNEAFDNTYWTYEFNVPFSEIQSEGQLHDVRDKIKDDISPKYNRDLLVYRLQTLGDLKAKRMTPAAKEALEKAKTLVRPMIEGWGGKTTINDEDSDQQVTMQSLKVNLPKTDSN